MVSTKWYAVWPTRAHILSLTTLQLLPSFTLLILLRMIYQEVISPHKNSVDYANRSDSIPRRAICGRVACKMAVNSGDLLFPPDISSRNIDQIYSELL